MLLYNLTVLLCYYFSATLLQWNYIALQPYFFSVTLFISLQPNLLLCNFFFTTLFNFAALFLGNPISVHPYLFFCNHIKFFATLFLCNPIYFYATLLSSLQPYLFLCNPIYFSTTLFVSLQPYLFLCNPIYFSKTLLSSPQPWTCSGLVPNYIVYSKNNMTNLFWVM